MTEIESLFKLFGTPGAILGGIIYVAKLFAPMVQKYLNNNEVTLKSIATSLSESVVWQRMADLRLERLEQQGEENTNVLMRLANANGVAHPRPTKPKRLVGTNEDR
ncbi:hypothetical protein [Herpetosiphon geysericola]|uniref:Uncharacterized protein n=1 Tax=Herpetosiphon geysericola TaxID=70996 RepID=A0A0P6XCK3_9CHLR|nr:hypothetical protein [Herpetosiphon geysericola]KPL80224.1 hypothetical protein SE18_24520 [Herpetosiphon geysericola]